MDRSSKSQQSPSPVGLAAGQRASAKLPADTQRTGGDGVLKVLDMCIGGVQATAALMSTHIRERRTALETRIAAIEAQIADVREEQGTIAARILADNTTLQLSDDKLALVLQKIAMRYSVKPDESFVVLRVVDTQIERNGSGPKAVEQFRVNVLSPSGEKESIEFAASAMRYFFYAGKAPVQSLKDFQNAIRKSGGLCLQATKPSGARTFHILNNRFVESFLSERNAALAKYRAEVCAAAERINPAYQRTESQHAALNKYVTDFRARLASVNTEVFNLTCADCEQNLEFLKATRALYVRRPPITVSERAIEGTGRVQYVLAIDGQPLVRWNDDGGFSEIVSEGRKEQFCIRRRADEEDPVTDERRPFRPRYADRSALLLGSGPSTFMTAKGCPLFGSTAEHAGYLFLAAQHGVQIFPTDDAAAIAQKLRPFSREYQQQQLAPRHWGQRFLETLEPDRIIPGALFVEGAHWKVYVFGRVIVAEADLPGNATYVGDSTALATFESMSRMEVLTQLPDGFIDRVIHRSDAASDQEEWRNRVRALVSSLRSH